MADLLTAVIDWWGQWGPVGYGLFYAIAVVALVPASPMTVAAGALFGPVVGGIVAWVGPARRRRRGRRRRLGVSRPIARRGDPGRLDCRCDPAGGGKVMRTNPVKRKLRGGGVAIGTMMMEFATTGVARIAAEAGAEFA